MGDMRWVQARLVPETIRVTYHVDYGMPKESPAPRQKRSPPNLRWRSSRRGETAAIRMGDRSGANFNDVRGFDVGIDLGSDSSAYGNRVEGPGPRQPIAAHQRTMLHIEGDARYVGMELCQTDGGGLIHAPKATDSSVQGCSATAPGWDRGKGGKK